MPEVSQYLVVLLAATAAALFAVLVGTVVLGASGNRMQRQRMDIFIRRLGGKESSGGRDRRAEMRRKQINAKMKSLKDKKGSKSRIGALRAIIARAGLETSVPKFLGICLGVGAVVAALWAVTGGPLVNSIGVGFVAGGLLPIMQLRRKAAKRQKEFTKYFATAIDIIVRGLRSGLPPQECFRIIGREIPDPCGAEFRAIINEMGAGMTMQEVLERSYQRMPTQELWFFSTVVSVQAETGGNLAEILANISGVMRGRTALREKAKALSSEAKASAVIVGAMPFVVATLLAVMNYKYVSLLWTTNTGTMILGGAACMMGFGMFVMMRLGKLDI